MSNKLNINYLKKLKDSMLYISKSVHNLDNQKVIDIHSLLEGFYTSIESIYFILGSTSNEYISLDIYFCNNLQELYGDFRGDCIINTLDYIKSVKNILDEEYNASCDLNQDTQCNITDAILLIDAIAELP